MSMGFFAAGAMGQGGGGGGFTYPPKVIYDLLDLSTLFQDAAGTVPVTGDGDPVGLLVDATGGGRDQYQSDNSRRPTYRTSGGIAWLEITSGKFLRTDNGDLSFAQTAHVYGYRAETGVVNYANVFGVTHATSHVAPYYRTNTCVRTSGGFEWGITSNGSQQLDRNTDAAAVGNDVLMFAAHSGAWRSDTSAMWYPLARVNKTLQFASAPGTQTITYPNSTPGYIGAGAALNDLFVGRWYGGLVSDANVTSQAWIDEWEAWMEARMP